MAVIFFIYQQIQKYNFYDKKNHILLEKNTIIQVL